MTKCFSNSVYKIGDTVVLTAGRPLPQPDQPRLRGEGVAIVLLPPVVSLWKSDGEQWKAWSPKIVSAHIKWMCGKRRTHLHIANIMLRTNICGKL